jgi:hypothetical protein
MVLVSIHPFALRKVFLVIVAFLCFSALCFADPVLMVRRYAAPLGQVAGSKTTVPTLRGPLEAQEASIAESGFGPLGSIDSALNQTELRFTEPGKVALPLTLPSSIFRKAMCELRAPNYQPGIDAGASLSLPGEN